jgi:hypothetical protein
VLACLSGQDYFRIAVVTSATQSGAWRAGAADLVIQVADWRESEAAFMHELALAVAKHGIAVVLPGNPAIAQVLSRGEIVLTNAGARPNLIDFAALAQLSAKGMPRLAEAAGLPMMAFFPVPFDASEAQPNLQDFAVAPWWPIYMSSGDGQRRRVIDAAAAVKAASDLAHGASALGGMGTMHLTAAAYAPDRVHEICLINNASGAELGAAAVRVLGDDSHARPWFAVSVDDSALFEAAQRFSKVLKTAGPMTFTVQEFDRAYYILDARPGFPEWVEIVNLDGPNLPAIWVNHLLGKTPEATETSTRVPAGALFSQSADDLVIDPGRPLALASQGEFTP